MKIKICRVCRGDWESYQLSRFGTTTGCSGKTRCAAAGKSGWHLCRKLMGGGRGWVKKSKIKKSNKEFQRFETLGCAADSLTCGGVGKYRGKTWSELPQHSHSRCMQILFVYLLIFRDEGIDVISFFLSVWSLEIRIVLHTSKLRVFGRKHLVRSKQMDVHGPWWFCINISLVFLMLLLIFESVNIKWWISVSI